MIILHKCVDVFCVLCASCLYESDKFAWSIISGRDYWTGLLEWTTGLTSDLNFRRQIITWPRVLQFWRYTYCKTGNVNEQVMLMNLTWNGIVNISTTSTIISRKPLLSLNKQHQHQWTTSSIPTVDPVIFRFRGKRTEIAE